MNDMLEYLQRSWWIFLLRGAAAIVFGIMAFAWPALTLAVLVILFGAYVLLDGVFGLVDAVRRRDRLGRIWPLVLESVLGIVVGRRRAAVDPFRGPAYRPPASRVDHARMDHRFLCGSLWCSFRPAGVPSAQTGRRNGHICLS